MIVIEDLRKNYGKITALDGLSLTIEDGEVFGLLGPNGAGKTTTIRILTSLSNPSSGSCSINGHDTSEEPEKVKAGIGVAPQHLNLDQELTGRENLDFYGRLHGMGTEERRKRIEELLDFVGLRERGDDLVEGYSGGMKRRLLIARAMMHRPRVLFLDEPTVGLDPQTRRRIWGMIGALKRGGTTVMLTTHYIEEAEMLCDRVGVIDRGRLIALGTPEELKRQVGRVAVELFTDTSADRRFFQNREEAFAYGSDQCSRERCAFLLREANLEDVFIELTGRRIRE